MAIKDWSQLPADNNQIANQGMPERQDRDSINDQGRGQMGALRTFFEDGEWLDHLSEFNNTFTVARAGVAQFNVVDGTGTDASSPAKFEVGDWLKITGTGGVTVTIAEVSVVGAYLVPNVLITVKNIKDFSDFSNETDIATTTVTKVEHFWSRTTKEAAYHSVGTTIGQAPTELIAIDDLGSAAAITEINNGTGLDADFLEGNAAGDFALSGGAAGKHYVLNSGMSIWQRGFSLTTGLVDEDFTADGWILLEEGNTFEVSRETTDVPPLYRYALKLLGTGTTDKAGMLHVLEGSDSKAIIGNGKASLGFWCHIPAASSMDKVRGAILEWSGATEDLADATAVATWNGGDSAPTFSAGWLKLGEVDFTTKGAWTFVKSENVSITAGTKNLAIFIWIEDDAYVTNNHVFITGVTLEPGAVATEAAPKMHGEEMMLCRRRFWTSYDHGVAPGTVAATEGAIFSEMTRAQNVGPNHFHFSVRFPMPMMKTPSVAIYAPTSGNIGHISDETTTDRNAEEVVTGTGTGGCAFNVSEDPVNLDSLQAHITASAEPSV